LPSAESDHRRRTTDRELSEERTGHHRFDGRNLGRKIVVLGELQIPPVLTSRLELERAFRVLGVDAIHSQCLALGVDQIEKLGRTGT
jgi:hypothetical protein